MSIGLRCILLIGALIVLFFMLNKIRQERVKIEYSLFWIFFSIIMVILGAFPVISYKTAALIGVTSPVNIVYLVIICVLLIKMFFMTIQISHLENKIDSIAERVALDKIDRDGEQNQ